MPNKLETLPHEGDDRLSNEWLVQCGWRYVLQQIRVVAALRLILLEFGVAEIKSPELDCSLLMMAINSDQVLLLGP